MYACSVLSAQPAHSIPEAITSKIPFTCEWEWMESRYGISLPSPSMFYIIIISCNLHVRRNDSEGAIVHLWLDPEKVLVVLPF